MTTRIRPALAAALCVLGLLTACGGSSEDEDGADVASLDDGSSTATTDGGGDDGETSPADREEAMLEFTECMRDHGIDMPDPQVDGEGGGMIELQADPEDEEFQEAQEACQPILDEAMGDLELDPEQEAEMREQLLEFAECMRDHGIDMPDPVFDEDGRVTMSAGEGPAGDIDEDEFRAASEECGRDGPGMVFDSESGDEGADG